MRRLFNDPSRRLMVLGGILAFGIVSTGLHFTHNFVAIDSYPETLISDAVLRAVIVVSWPLFTALGLLGYRLYSRRSFASAHLLLIAYGVFAATSLGHFLDGSPDVAAFWFATIFTDALAGFAMLAFVALSARLVGGRAASTPERHR